MEQNSCLYYKLCIIVLVRKITPTNLSKLTPLRFLHLQWVFGFFICNGTLCGFCISSGFIVRHRDGDQEYKGWKPEKLSDWSFLCLQFVIKTMMVLATCDVLFCFPLVAMSYLSVISRSDFAAAL